MFRNGSFAAIFFCCLACAATSVHAAAVHATLSATDERVEKCLAQLPMSVRAALRDPASRSHLQLSAREQRVFAACAVERRAAADAVASEQLRDALVAMAQRAPEFAGHAVPQPVRDEAAAIAQRLVMATQTQATLAHMVGSPLFNNFLMHVGARRGGYCYQWTIAELEALHTLPHHMFDWQWAVAAQGHVTENNAVVMTLHGQPLHSGIVYDAWRGAGHPWWRAVAKDHYRWRTRE